MNDSEVKRLWIQWSPWKDCSRSVKRYLGADGERRTGPIKEVTLNIPNVKGIKFICVISTSLSSI